MAPAPLIHGAISCCCSLSAAQHSSTLCIGDVNHHLYCCKAQQCCSTRCGACYSSTWRNLMPLQPCSSMIFLSVLLAPSTTKPSGFTELQATSYCSGMMTSPHVWVGVANWGLASEWASFQDCHCPSPEPCVRILD